MIATFEADRLARFQRSGEVFGFHFLLSQRLANLLHLTDGIDGNPFAGQHVIDVFKAKRIQAFTESSAL
jgi:hypothetical protein